MPWPALVFVVCLLGYLAKPLKVREPQEAEAVPGTARREDAELPPALELDPAPAVTAAPEPAWTLPHPTCNAHTDSIKDPTPDISHVPTEPHVSRWPRKRLTASDIPPTIADEVSRSEPRPLGAEP